MAIVAPRQFRKADRSIQDPNPQARRTRVATARWHSRNATVKRVAASNREDPPVNSAFILVANESCVMAITDEQSVLY
jgi:hypothetical protein